jgi:hypothetical protein
MEVPSDGVEVRADYFENGATAPTYWVPVKATAVNHVRSSEEFFY